MTVQIPNNTAPTVYTPASLITVFAKLLRYTAEEKEQLCVRGVYQATGMKRYNGVYYDQLQEETTDHTLTIKVPERIRMELESGLIYTFTGALERGLRKDGSIALCLVVFSLEGKETPQHSAADEERFALLQAKMERGVADVQATLKGYLYRGDRPRLAMIYGEQAIVDTDVMMALRDAEQYYDLTEFRVNMKSVTELCDVLEEVADGDYQACALIRGGGSGLEVFSDHTLVRAALELPVPLLTALGHAEDTMFLEKVADKVFTTPTALGVFLRELAEEVILEREQSRTHLLEELKKQFAEQIGRERALFEKEIQLLRQLAQQQSVQGSQKEQYLFYGLIAAGVIILLLLLLLWM